MWFLALMLGLGLLYLAILLLPGGAKFLEDLFGGRESNEDPTPDQLQAVQDKIAELQCYGYHQWYWEPRKFHFETAVNLFRGPSSQIVTWTYFFGTTDRTESPAEGVKVGWFIGNPINWIDHEAYPVKLENPKYFDLVVIWVNNKPTEVYIKIK